MGQHDESSTSEKVHHLLIAEDNPGDIRMIKEAFREAQLGTTIHAVASGESALDFVYQRGEYDAAPRPDVVLLDWSLLKLSGPEVLSELKADFPDLSVLIMSGSKPRSEVVESEVAQADGYLTKPAEPEGYLEAILSVD